MLVVGDYRVELLLDLLDLLDMVSWWHYLMPWMPLYKFAITVSIFYA